MRLMPVALSLLAVACGGEPRSPLSPTASAPYAGRWTGATSQGQKIAFGVSVDTVGQLEFAADFRGASCNGGLSYGSTSPLAAITNAAFTASVTPGPVAGQQFAFSIAGRFAGPSYAEGTLRVSHTGTAGVPCTADVEMTWTATRTP